jgi:hypothetical protein
LPFLSSKSTELKANVREQTISASHEWLPRWEFNSAPVVRAMNLKCSASNFGATEKGWPLIHAPGNQQRIHVVPACLQSRDSTKTLSWIALAHWPDRYRHLMDI